MATGGVRPRPGVSPANRCRRKLRSAIRPASLAGVCYLSVALALTEQVAVGVCADPACGRPFFIRDKRQRFCDRACGNRVRFQRFKDKHGESAKPTKEGDR